MTTKEKRQELRQHAIKLSLCTTCLFRDSLPFRTRCENCISYARKANERLRKMPDRCCRCGQKKNDSKYKTCNKCRK